MTARPFFSFAVLVSAVWSISFFVPRTSHGWLFALYILAWLSLWNLMRDRDLSYGQLSLMAVIIRVPLLWATPLLSDDFYRFLWDGMLSLHGVNVYAFTPVMLILHPQPWMEELYPYLNSPAYYSIYPPLLQPIFLVSAFFYRELGMLAGLCLLRMPIFLADMVSLKGLKKISVLQQLPLWPLSVFALNPLLLLEGITGIHYEPLAATALIYTLLYLPAQPFRSGLAFGLSVMVKLNPLLFVPALVLHVRSRRSVSFAGGVFLILVFVFLASFFLHPWFSILESTRLYFTHFEFNGSIYKIIRWWGYENYGYNKIRTWGPKLSLCTAIIICVAALFFSRKHLYVSLLAAYLIYLAGSSIVHPWYAIPIVPLALLFRKRWPFYFAGCMFFSYGFYTRASVTDSLLVTFLVYGLPFIITAADYIWQKRIHNADK